MQYTLWSRGRMLGESELDYRRVFDRHRTGDFFPTDVGARLMSVATGVSATVIDLARISSALPRGSEKGNPSNAPGVELRQTSEYADFAAAQDHRDALALELRGPDGSVIPTEWIDVRDTEFLLSLALGDGLDIENSGSVFSDDVDDEFAGPCDVDYGTLDHACSLRDFHQFDESGPDLEEPYKGHSEDAVPRYQLQVMLRDDAAVP